MLRRNCLQQPHPGLLRTLVQRAALSHGAPAGWAGNMLVVRPGGPGGRRGSSTALGGGSGLARLAEARCALRPIDHGFCLPEALEPPYLEWLHWPQVLRRQCASA